MQPKVELPSSTLKAGGGEMGTASSHFADRVVKSDPVSSHLPGRPPKSDFHESLLDAPRIPSTPSSAPTDFIQGGYTGVDLAKGTDETRVFVVREEKAAPDGAWLKTYKNDYDRFSDVLLRPAGWLHMWRDFTQNSVFDFCFIQGMRLGEKAPTTVALDGQKPIPENIRESYTTAFSDLSRLLLGKTVSGVVLRGHLGEMFLEFTDGSTVAIGVCLYEGNGIMTCGRAVAMEGKR